MATDRGSVLLFDLMSTSLSLQERVLVVDGALRNAGLLDVPLSGRALRAFVNRPFRAAAVDVVGEERAEEVVARVLDYLDREAQADTVPPRLIVRVAATLLLSVLFQIRW